MQADNNGDIEDAIRLLEEGPRQVFDLDIDLFEKVVETIDTVEKANRFIETTPENVEDYRDKLDIMVEKLRSNLKNYSDLRAIFMIDETDRFVDHRLIEYYDSVDIRVFQAKLNEENYTKRTASYLENKAKKAHSSGKDYWSLMEVLECGMKNLWEVIEEGYDTDMWVVEEVSQAD